MRVGLTRTGNSEGMRLPKAVIVLPGGFSEHLRIAIVVLQVHRIG